MRVLLINPNTSETITARVTEAARAFARPGTHLIGATGRFGARYIASRAAAAIAAHAALDAWAEHATAVDAVVLACFGDPGLDALRELAPHPVIGFADEACRHAAALGDGRFAIVTGGAAWGPMLAEFVEARGLGEQLAAVITVAPTGADIARDPEGAVEMLTRACNEAVTRHGATSVVLGGAGLAGLASRVSPGVRVPLVDPVQVSVHRAQSRVTADEAAGRLDRPDGPPAVEAVGLTGPLTARLAGR